MKSLKEIYIERCKQDQIELRQNAEDQCKELEAKIAALELLNEDDCLLETLNVPGTLRALAQFVSLKSQRDEAIKMKLAENEAKK